MYTLFIDTTKEQSSIKIFQGQAEIRQLTWPSEKRLGQDLLPNIIGLVKQAHLRLSDIGAVLVCPGPGSFTGSRIGVSVANSLAWSLHVGVCAADEQNLAQILEKLSDNTSFVSVVTPYYDRPASTTLRST